MKILIILVLSHSLLAFDSENIREFWNEKDSKDLIDNKQDIYYQGHQGTKNYYAHFYFVKGEIEAPLFLITGLEDPVPMWFDTVLLAKKKGFRNIFIIELRGQGQSERVPGNTKKLIHVEKFHDYNIDLINAFKHISKNSQLRFDLSYFIAHSTGALIFTKTYSSIKKVIPSIFIKGASLWTPLYAVELNPLLNNTLVKPIVSLFNKVYRKYGGVFCAKSYKVKGFKDNMLTTDRDKFKRSQDIKLKYGLGSSGVSLHWVLELVESLKSIENNINDISFPTIMFKVDNDRIVSNDYQFSSDYIEIVNIKDSRHALNIERDSILIQVWEKTLSFWGLSKKSFN